MNISTAAMETYETYARLLQQITMNPRMFSKKTWDNYYSLAFKAKEPLEWVTENKIVLSQPIMNLRHFPNPKEQKAQYPVLILTPNAGHDSKLADYAEKQSLVRTLHAEGFEVYVCEWLNATSEEAHIGIDEYIDFTDQSVNFMKKTHQAKQIHLIGQCQGGWQAAMYTSLFPENISSLVVAGSPIDFRAEYGALNYFVEKLPSSTFRLITAHGYLPGKTMLTNFKMLQANEHYHLKYLRKFMMALNDDQDAIERNNHFDAWYENPQNLPGKFYIEVIRNVFRNNCMAHPNSFFVKDKPVDLRKIHCPIVAVGGTKDHITPSKQCFGIENLVSTPKKDITKILVEAGHIGVLMGKKTLENEYPKICDVMKRIESV